jgi:phytoene synthase
MIDAHADAVAEYLPRPGTDLYYAQLYLPPRRRQLLALTESLRGEIARVPASCSSPEIAATKLAWWREEIARLAGGAPRHALTTSLHARMDEVPSLPDAALALVDGIASLLDTVRFATRDERFAAFDAAHGPLWQLVNAQCAMLDAAAAATARRLGSRIEEAYALRDTRRYVAGGAALLAQDSVRQAESATTNGPLDDGDWYARVLALDIEHAIAALRRELAALRERRRLRPLATLARLACATLEEVQADGSRVWDRRVELTPLRKLWLAWRERGGI